MTCTTMGKGSFITLPSDPLAPSEGYCVFEVKASGICGSDIPRLFQGGAYHYPLVVGHEFSGIVKDSTNKALVGKCAAVFPILPCGKCDACQKQQWASCAHYDYYGSRRDGGMQSELLIKESNLVFLPDGVSFESGAMIEPAAVCLHAIRKASVDKDTRVLIYGAGTIGMLCGMWARAKGAARVFFSEPNKERVALAEKAGFTPYDGTPVDTVIEASGVAVALADAIERCVAHGKIVLVGHGPADVTLPHGAFVKILRKELSLLGSWNSEHTDTVDDWRESAEAIASGALPVEQLITHRVPLSRANDALCIIAERKEIYNKIMVVMNDAT